MAVVDVLTRFNSGKELVIKATGSVKKTIEKGAYIDLVVKYGLIRLIKTRADLCDEIGEVDMECPVEPGERVISKTVELPKEIPPVSFYANSTSPFEIL